MEKGDSSRTPFDDLESSALTREDYPGKTGHLDLRQSGHHLRSITTNHGGAALRSWQTGQGTGKRRRLTDVKVHWLTSEIIRTSTNHEPRPQTRTTTPLYLNVGTNHDPGFFFVSPKSFRNRFRAHRGAGGLREPAGGSPSSARWVLLAALRFALFHGGVPERAASSEVAITTR